MILKDCYTPKKRLISATLNKSLVPSNKISVGLFTDAVFKENTKATFPLVLFKYNTVDWNTPSKNVYKAYVHFSVFVVLGSVFEDDYLACFDSASKIDKAVLLCPTSAELEQNQMDLDEGATMTKSEPNSALKAREEQYTVTRENFVKNEYFIWEIEYNTILVENMHKKKYRRFTNGTFWEKQLNKKKREKVKEGLRKMGSDLEDY